MALGLLKEYRFRLVRRIGRLEAFIRTIAYCPECRSAVECHSHCQWNEQRSLAREVLNGHD